MALRDAAQLSRDRVRDGAVHAISRCSSPTSSCSSWSSQLARTRGDQLRVVAQLYRALGGGWQPEQQPGAACHAGHADHAARAAAATGAPGRPLNAR